MTKEEMLLSMAIDCVNWGEGSDFEMKEVIYDGGYEKEVKKHYPELWADMNILPEDHPDYDEDAEYDNMDKVCDHIQSEITALLRKLREPHECPIEKAKKAAAKKKREESLQAKYNKG